MSYEQNVRSVSFNADASAGVYTGVPGQPGSLSPNGGTQYKLCKLTAKDTVGLCTAAGDAVVGVIQNKPQKTGAAVTVGYEGITNVIAGAACAVGDLLVPDATGRGVQGAAGRLRALQAATAANEVISAMFVI